MPITTVYYKILETVIDGIYATIAVLRCSEQVLTEITGQFTPIVKTAESEPNKSI